MIPAILYIIPFCYVTKSNIENIYTRECTIVSIARTWWGCSSGGVTRKISSKAQMIKFNLSNFNEFVLTSIVCNIAGPPFAIQILPVPTHSHRNPEHRVCISSVESIIRGFPNFVNELCTYFTVRF